MREIFDCQRYFNWSGGASNSEIVRVYEQKYNRISELLDENPELLEIAARDLSRLSRGGKKGRRATYTCENLFRAIIVRHLEGESLRSTEIRLAHTPFLQQFVRLGTRPVMSYAVLQRAVKALQPDSWNKINGVLTKAAVETGRIDSDRLRVDTTVVEANIHFPTDSSLLWDSWRTLYRLMFRLRREFPERADSRFHQRKVKKLHLFVTRYTKSLCKKRQRRVRLHRREFLRQVDRILERAKELKRVLPRTISPTMAQIYSYVPRIEKVLSVAKRAWLQGEKVPASERIFSIFEPHVELIKRGRREKPVEFGHMILLGQSRDRFVTQYEVMPKKIPDSQLPERILDRHEATFGTVPVELAADKGFCGRPEAMDSLRKRVKVVAIPQRLKDFQDKHFVALQHFRAGIEGSISVLKRAFGLLRCQFRTFKSFASHVGLGVFCHNLVILTRPT